MARHELETAIKDLGISISKSFVPFSQSRNKADKLPSLNWRVTLQKNGRKILSTDYSAGCGRAPSYKQGDNSVRRDQIVREECESGVRVKLDSCDVVYSLVSDADVLNCSGFEDWAQSFGYDTDSRKAEKIYHDCLEIALKLRNSLGDDGLQALQEACQDY